MDFLRRPFAGKREKDRFVIFVYILYSDSIIKRRDGYGKNGNARGASGGKQARGGQGRARHASLRRAREGGDPAPRRVSVSLSLSLPLPSLSLSHFERGRGTLSRARAERFASGEGRGEGGGGGGEREEGKKERKKRRGDVGAGPHARRVAPALDEGGVPVSACVHIQASWGSKGCEVSTGGGGLQGGKRGRKKGGWKKKNTNKKKAPRESFFLSFRSYLSFLSSSLPCCTIFCSYILYRS